MNTTKVVAWIVIMLIFALVGTANANWQRVSIGGGSEPRYLQDVNNDGWVDSISTTRWYKNPGDGTRNWTGFSIGNTDFPFPCGRIVGDVNGDGLPDLVIGVGRNYPAPDRNKIFAFINPGDTGKWTRYHIGTLRDSDDGVEAVGIGDMNNDGHPDILAGGECAELRWYVNPGTMRDNWAYHIIHHFRFQRGGRWITTDVEDLLIKDFNNDKFLDVAVNTSSPFGFSGSVQVFWNPQTGIGNWSRIQLENEAVQASKRSVIRTLSAGDIDQDGRIDIVFANCQPFRATALFWYRNNGTLPWTRYTIDTLSSRHLKHSRPVVADINLDGRPDVICFRYDSGATYWYKNPGGGGSWPRIKIYGTALFDQGIGDVDKDGDVDIISAGFWYKNPGDVGIDEPLPILPIGNSCFIATAAYGTPLAQEVEVLSRLRDEHLLTNELGQRFVALYERHNHALAEFISEREWTKSIVRIALWPLVMMAELVVDQRKLKYECKCK